MAFGPSDWMNKARVLTYTRISDAKQTKGDRTKSEPKKKPAIIQQYERVQRGLKDLKLPSSNKTDEWFAEVQSGTDRDRGQWKALMSRAMELRHKGKKVFIAIQDPSRWSRNTRHAMTALDRLHDLGVPVLAVREGIQTGSTGDLHPTEELIFLQLSGAGAFVSQEQKKKADIAVDVTKELGVMSGKGTSLYPFAREDPLWAYLDQLPLLEVPAKEGGGPTALRGTIQGMTQPNGMTATSAIRLFKREEERRKKLSDKEYQEWYDYRNMIRNLLIELDHDPYAVKPNKVGPRSWKARALMRMVGRYLREPWQYKPRSDEEIQTILKNPSKFLGTKDLKRFQG